MRLAKIAVEAATYAIDKPYTYLVPEEMPLSVGCRVLVPFGRGNRVSEGMVLELVEDLPGGALKSVRLNVDGEPIATAAEIKLALWMRQRYFCTFYDAIRTVLPAAVWYRYKESWQSENLPIPEDLPRREMSVLQLLQDSSMETEQIVQQLGESAVTCLHALEKRGLVQRITHSHRAVADKHVSLLSLAVGTDEALLWADSNRRSAKMCAVLRFLAKQGETPLQEVLYFTGASRASVTALEKKGLVSLRQQEQYRLTRYDCALNAAPIVLNDEQQRVYEEMLQRISSDKAGVTLLHGVTGSGKTQIYIRLAQALLEQGKTVMILVPEIALTPQMMARFSAYFGEKVALLHSGLRMTERYDQFKRIRRGEATVVLGTRSAVFAPLRNIGLIILDEEQESSYESEQSPSYHARDIAKYRCFTENAQLLLGSATPTVESAYYAEKGDYHLSRLDKRYNEKSLPRVIVADMRRELRDGNFSCISRPLYEELKANIDRGEQSILFLNRRGSSRQLLCPNCGHVPQCPRCSVYLTYHSANDRLMCHYCGHSRHAETECPECGTKLRRIGFGTQKVEEELHQLFPETPILRMDADTVTMGHESVLREFSEKQIPILLGTQMVAKGLDFENVTLVGVLAADLSLYVDHYRASERTFSLLTQVVGRAGRGEKEGRAVIQTYTPDNEVIQAAAEQDYQRFYDGELRLRKLRRDPPFADFFTMTVVGTDENEVRRAARELQQSLRYAVEHPPYDTLDVTVLGPAPASVVKIAERYRYRVSIIGENNKHLRGLLSHMMKEFSRHSENRRMQVYVDCNLMDER